MIEFLRGLLEQPITLFALLLAQVLGFSLIAYDISTNNRKISNLMKATWFLAVSYTGLVASFIYFIAGKTFDQSNHTWRQTLRSITRSLSGAGFGVLVSLIVSQGLLNLNPLFTLLLAIFAASYASYYLAVLPLIRRGLEKANALKDVFYGRIASVTVMSGLAVSFVYMVAPDAKISDVEFWTSTLIALSIGYLAAFPINYNLVKILRINDITEIK